MPNMQNKLPRLAVRDSFDDEDLSDIDDEVFIRDGKNGILKIDDECGVNRPLMAPRRKFKSVPEKVSLSYLIFSTLCYAFMALIILLMLIILCIFVIHLAPMPLIIKRFFTHGTEAYFPKEERVPCTSLTSKIVWTKTLPKLTSEAPLRSNDVNSDDIEDIIVGFSTGLDATDTQDYVCNLYFKDQKPCFGGILALDGKSGEIIWTHWCSHAIFSVDCNLDLTGDTIKDCIISGRGGILHAVNGADGNSIWEIPNAEKELPLSENRDSLDIYDAKFIVDVNDDEIGDVIASHIVQTEEKLLSEIVVISGKSGKIIRNVELPDTEELFVAPQVLVHPDGENIFVIVTNSQKQSGGLYVIPQSQLMQGELKLRKLHHNAGKGVLLAPILVDITLDGTEDIVAAMFNSTVVAYDGKSFQQIWNYTIPNSEVISIPIPGYYDDDNIPDFMVKHQMGPGFPVYYYTVATILNGKTGKPLLEEPMSDSMSAQMSGLSISVEDFGNDWFLHWSADCLNHEGSKEKYQFFKQENSNLQSRSDLCKLRFNSTLTSSLFAFSQHVGPPGIPLYYSEDWKKLEFNTSFDPREAAENYFETHSLDNKDLLENDDVSERSPKIRKNSEEKFQQQMANDQMDTDFLGKDKFDLEDYKDEEPQIIGFEDKVPDDLSIAEELRDLDKWDEEMRPKKVYDVLYDDDSNRLSQNEMRSQRSDKVISTINNDTNDVQNKLDPSMDYTNGQSKRYYSLEPVNRTNSLDDNSDYFPDMDFTDDLEEVPKIMEKRQIRKKMKAEPRKKMKAETRKEMKAEKRKEMKAETRKETKAETRKETKLTENGKNVKSEFGKKTKSEKQTMSNNGQKEFPLDTQNGNYEMSIKLDKKPKEKIPTKKWKVIKKKPTVESEEQKSLSRTKRIRRQSTLTKVEAKDNFRKRMTKRSFEDTSAGVQRQPPTGILLKSLQSFERDSIDLVFSTYWLPATETPIVLIQRDLDCIKRKEENDIRKMESSFYDVKVKECLAERGVDFRYFEEARDRENAKIALGQMTVYRMQLQCVCPRDLLPDEKCKDILLRQSWPAHLGAAG